MGLPDTLRAGVFITITFCSHQEDPRAPLAGNLRPSQPSNGRLVRTNINFDQNQDVDCREAAPAFQYEAASLWAEPRNSF